MFNYIFGRYFKFSILSTIIIFSEEGLLEITIQSKIHLSIPKMRMIHDEDGNMNMIRQIVQNFAILVQLP